MVNTQNYFPPDTASFNWTKPGSPGSRLPWNPAHICLAPGWAWGNSAGAPRGMWAGLPWTVMVAAWLIPNSSALPLNPSTLPAYAKSKLPSAVLWRSGRAISFNIASASINLSILLSILNLRLPLSLDYRCISECLNILSRPLSQPGLCWWSKAMVPWGIWL